MQGVLSMVAGQAMPAGSLVLGSAPFGNGSTNTNGVVAVITRKPFAATLDIASAKSFGHGARLGSVSHSFPLGKRLRRSCVRVSALQQSTPSAKSVKWVLDPCGTCCVLLFRIFGEYIQ